MHLVSTCFCAHTQFWNVLFQEIFLYILIGDRVIVIDGFSFQGRKIYLPRIDDHVIPCNIRRPLYRIRPLILPIPNTHFTETTNNLRLIILTAPKQCLLVTLIAGFCGLPPHYNASQLNQPLYEFMVGKNPKDFAHEDMGAKNIFKYFKTYID